MRLNVIFRVDASPAAGLGHLTRCMTLAEHLALEGARAFFLLAGTNERIARRVTNAGFTAIVIAPKELQGSRIENGIDWYGDACACLDAIRTIDQPILLVVDHYGLDSQWEQALRPAVARILVIDDLANREHECDWLLDQTYGRDKLEYHHLVPSRCILLLGSEFALLRAQFSHARPEAIRRRQEFPPRRTHVFFGGHDRGSNTLRFTAMLITAFPLTKASIALDFDSAGSIRALEALSNLHPGRIELASDVMNMAQHIAACDFAIGSPGITTWERACMGVPAALIAISDNQVPILASLELAGLCVFLGRDIAINEDLFVERLRELIGDGNRLTAMRELGMAAVDGAGAKRVAHEILAG